MLKEVELTNKDLQRYDRQLRLPALGGEGQKQLKKAKVVIVGLGGLGSSCSIYLAVAGVGHISIYDSDVVELSNLNRQILYCEDDIGKPKASSAAKKLSTINKEIKVEAYSEKIEEWNAERAVKDADVVVDCLDNFPTRYILNLVCIKLGKPLIHAAIYGLEGYLTTIIPGETPCLVCLYGPEVPPEVKPTPIMGVAPGIMGVLEALEAIKLITGLGKILRGRLLRFDGEDGVFELFKVKRKPDCPVCGNINLSPRR